MLIRFRLSPKNFQRVKRLRTNLRRFCLGMQTFLLQIGKHDALPISGDRLSTRENADQVQAKSKKFPARETVENKPPEILPRHADVSATDRKTRRSSDLRRQAEYARKC